MLSLMQNDRAGELPEAIVVISANNILEDKAVPAQRKTQRHVVDHKTTHN